MGDELAATNATRSYSLSATSIAIFTFTLFFLYPRFASGEIKALFFQATLRSPVADQIRFCERYRWTQVIERTRRPDAEVVKCGCNRETS